MNTVLWIFVLGLFAVMGIEIYSAWSTPLKGLAAVGILCMMAIAGIGAEVLYGRRVLKACDGIIRRLEDGPRG